MTGTIVDYLNVTLELTESATPEMKILLVQPSYEPGVYVELHIKEQGEGDGEFLKLNARQIRALVDFLAPHAAKPC